MMKVIKALLGIAVLVSIVVLGFSLYLTTQGPGKDPKPERQMSQVWADYPYTSKYAEVNGSRMHYIDEGPRDGPVFLFMHGNPSSSYLWRSVIDDVAVSGIRAVAVDNIGFGASDHPEIDYSFADHVAYTEGFIDALELENVTLVLHDWGAAIGSDYASRYANNVRGIILVEPFFYPPNIEQLPTTDKIFVAGMRTPVIGELLVMGMNLFIEMFVPSTVMRDLSEEEMNAYREPFDTYAARYPMLAWPRQVPMGGEPEDVGKRFAVFWDWLSTSDVPKLFLHIEGSRVVAERATKEILEDWQQVDTQLLDEGLHFVQEDKGAEIAAAIIRWSASLPAQTTQ